MASKVRILVVAGVSVATLAGAAVAAWMFMNPAHAPTGLEFEAIPGPSGTLERDYAPIDTSTLPPLPQFLSDTGGDAPAELERPAD